MVILIGEDPERRKWGTVRGRGDADGTIASQSIPEYGFTGLSGLEGTIAIKYLAFLIQEVSHAVEE